jgi:hypothetical protein
MSGLGARFLTDSAVVPKATLSVLPTSVHDPSVWVEPAIIRRSPGQSQPAGRRRQNRPAVPTPRRRKGDPCAAIRLAWPAHAVDVLRWPACIVPGEWLFMWTRPDRWSLWPLSLVVLAIFGLPAVLGAWIARFTLRRLRSA